jgi:hypothetical protein
MAGYNNQALADVRDVFTGKLRPWKAFKHKVSVLYNSAAL